MLVPNTFPVEDVFDPFHQILSGAPMTLENSRFTGRAHFPNGPYSPIQLRFSISKEAAKWRIHPGPTEDDPFAKMTE
jgi:hypothetical protein